jgi:predicted transcriptional regulator
MPQPLALEMAAEVVTAFVSNNRLPRGELPALIQTIHDTLARLFAGVETSTPKEEPKEPAVSIRKSVTPGYLICLEDGKHFKSLKRHLAAYGLTPEQYRANGSFPPTIPWLPPTTRRRGRRWRKRLVLGSRAEAPERANADDRRKRFKPDPHCHRSALGQNASTSHANVSRRSRTLVFARRVHRHFNLGG